MKSDLYVEWGDSLMWVYYLSIITLKNVDIS